MSELLENADRARIDPRKLRDYVLDPQHDSGKFKAAFFLQMGYKASGWERLANDIRQQLLVLPAQTGNQSPYGEKYTITGALQGPVGSSRQVTTVWIFRRGKREPELVTISPARKRKDMR